MHVPAAHSAFATPYSNGLRTERKQDNAVLRSWQITKSRRYLLHVEITNTFFSVLKNHFQEYPSLFSQPLRSLPLLFLWRVPNYLFSPNKLTLPGLEVPHSTPTPQAIRKMAHHCEQAYGTYRTDTALCPIRCAKALRRTKEGVGSQEPKQPMGGDSCIIS